ncbi:tetraacyldisaccharide 4'-kinase [Rhizobium paknamense]|uniref:Tetraacyldisaccharide 4'-kinase n=1 Tax=Rhizobium paknamense TaxID=1206817 RepID=A0ABU0I9U8_9HYPH|nr:tetraacyldisaccharide 4'-kinase [Rhizobium paknamense]MDQ0454992.1 tetraacyldisaccharide 4'-kinase [Rhizobium paknamense]
MRKQKLDAPSFWWRKPDWRAFALLPLSLLYGHIAGRRMARAKRQSADLPVICVGNFTLGGAGKTPTALALAKAAKAMGLRPGFLSRGYGGRLKTTTLVYQTRHTAAEVGDEPLLLAREAMTVISPHRTEGAAELARQGVDLIIMDDGFQSARLTLDFALVVVDRRRGTGNDLVFPAGPLRAPLPKQIAAMDAMLLVGEPTAGTDGSESVVRLVARAGKPVLTARLHPVTGSLSGERVLAYCGIADPTKFHRTLEELQADLVVTRAFGDHQPLSPDEIEGLLATADEQDLQLVTTAKDAVRLKGGKGRTAELAARSKVVEIEMRFDDPDMPRHVIEQALANFRARVAK